MLRVHTYIHILQQFNLLTTGCTIGGIDLVFVLDVSGSIGASQFQLIREFTANLSKLLDIGPQRSLVGVVLFSTTARVHFPVTKYTNTFTLLPALNPGLPYIRGSTNTAAALNLLRTSGQPGGALGLRHGYTHVAIVVTDGKSDNGIATLNAASTLRTVGIYHQIYAVGISGANATELNVIGGDPLRVFFTSSFNSTAIAALQQSVTQQLCSDTSELHNCVLG